MAFKGGTSLSKVYHLIDRFSEDIDITIDYHEFSPTTDLHETYSKTALKKLSDNLKTKLNEHVHNIIVPYLKKALSLEVSSNLHLPAFPAVGKNIQKIYT